MVPYRYSKHSHCSLRSITHITLINTHVPQTIYCNVECKQETSSYYFLPLSDKLNPRRTRNEELPGITAVVGIGPGAEHDGFSNRCVGFKRNKSPGPSARVYGLMHHGTFDRRVCLCVGVLVCVAAFALDCCASCSEVGYCSLTSERSVESDANSLKRPRNVCVRIVGNQWAKMSVVHTGAI